jgi:DNA-binding GntR family transcriptional regulator
MQYVIYQFMPIPNAPPNLEKRSMREDVYAVLREWIVIGTLEPGEKLRDVDIAAHLGVSRTPVREALRRLEDEGLIETKQNAWTRVSGVTGALAARIYPILQALEPLALELAAPHLTRADLRAMRRVNKHIQHALEVNDARAAATWDAEFHDAFVGKCNNPELTQIIRTLKTNHIRLEIHYWRGGRFALESVVEHERMVAALEQHNLATAKFEIERNWIRALERWEATRL